MASFQKGKKKTGGRKKGVINKRSQKAMEILANEKFCPLLKMIEMYERGLKEFKDDRSDFRFKYLEIAANQLKELAQYAFPKRKAIDFPIDEETGQSLIDIVKAVARSK